MQESEEKRELDRFKSTMNLISGARDTLMMVVTIISIMRFTSSSIRHALLMVMAIRMVDATAAPDNFFLTFDKDLHAFGMKEQLRNKKSIGVEETIKLTPNVVHTEDDFDKAEEEIFHRVKDAERAVRGVAGDLMRDEVNVIFGDIKKHNVDGQDARKMTSDGKAITNANDRSIAFKKIKPAQKVESRGLINGAHSSRFLETMKAFADHYYEYPVGHERRRTGGGRLPGQLRRAPALAAHGRGYRQPRHLTHRRLSEKVSK